MPDRLTQEQRSRLMSRVKAKNTSVEKIIFGELKKRKIQFKKHFTALPGTPDIVFVNRKVVVFVDGDFWHGYRFPIWGMKLTPFWKKKILENRLRDRKNFAKLRRRGWHVMRVWQHSIEKNLPDTVAKIEKLTRTHSNNKTGKR